MEKKIKVGEVVEATTSEFTSQCYEVNRSPSLGKLLKVRAGDIDIYAVLRGATTTGIEHGRYPLARGKELAEESEVFKANPQLLKLLRTLFTSQVVGYGKSSLIYHRFPPYPARLHSFVFSCEKEEVLDFTRSYDFLNLLLSDEPCQDQVAAACLRQIAEVHPSPHAFLVGAGKRLAQTLGNEVERLNYLLRSLKD